MIYNRTKGSRQIGNYLAGLSRQIAFPLIKGMFLPVFLVTSIWPLVGQNGEILMVSITLKAIKPPLG